MCSLSRKLYKQPHQCQYKKMVLESLTNPFHAEKHVVLLFFLGIVYATVGVWLSYWVFADQASIVMIVLIVMAAMPLFYKTMIHSEKQTVETDREFHTLQLHTKTLTFLLVFFLGMTIAFALWHIALPEQTSTKVFHVQEATIVNLNQQVTGGAAQVDLFSNILFNNIKVLIFSLLFSFIFGSGALFILAWNSSVIGTAMGNFVDTYVAQAAQGIANPTSVYFFGAGMSLVRYFTHGIPEVLAYFVGGLAGGIISVAFLRGHLKTSFDRVATDFSDLVIISVLLLVIAGLIEVFVTPVFF